MRLRSRALDNIKQGMVSSSPVATWKYSLSPNTPSLIMLIAVMKRGSYSFHSARLPSRQPCARTHVPCEATHHPVFSSAAYLVSGKNNSI